MYSHILCTQSTHDRNVSSLSREVSVPAIAAWGGGPESHGALARQLTHDVISSQLL